MVSVYRSVKQTCEVKIEINKSLFIAYVSPAETETAAVSFIEEIRKRHKEASHNCSAYIIGRHGRQQKADDDGEPGGTAGRPILEVLNKADIKNAVIVVTRYFGGIKLGAGGLIRAYTQAAAAGLAAAVIVEKQLHIRLAIVVDYSLLGTVENQLRLNNYPVEAKEFAETVTITALARKGGEDKLSQLIADCTSAQAVVRETGEIYLEVLPAT